MSKFLQILFLNLCFVLSKAQKFDEIEIQTTKISDHIFMLEGSGGNIGLSIGEDGALMVDSQFAPLSDKIRVAIEALTDQPIKLLLNTHWHSDHTGGNENFGTQGAMIVAHENVKERMSEVQSRPFSREVPASPEIARPVLTFTDQMGIKCNGEHVMLIHVDHAHTDGDAFVYFPESDVMHMGDVYFNARYPYIDLSSGGSIDGMIDAVEKALFVVGDETVIIPGHGALSNKSELKTYHEVLKAARDKVKVAITAGKTLDEIKEMKPTRSTDAIWGKAFISPEKFIDQIFNSLTSEPTPKSVIFRK